ncbi:MAG: hypothetical protein HY319_10610 [Armatimonadetes bacterium]|nr:hypothetical protein [Armatimonadota bacterium]
MKVRSTPPTPLRQEPLYRAAEGLMASRDIRLEDHVLLRENIASCLSQMGPEVLEDPDRLKQAVATDPRWGYKVARDLEKPYTDQQVFEKLDDLESRCRELALHSYPSRTWHVSGSIPKGRFGANSDADLTCDGGFRPGQLELLDSLPAWEASAFRVEFQSGDPEVIHGSAQSGHDVSAVFVTGGLLERKLSEYDAAVPLEIRQLEQQHGFLADVYQQALQSKGYAVKRDPAGKVQVTSPEVAPEHPLEKVWRRPG